MIIAHMKTKFKITFPEFLSKKEKEEYLFGFRRDIEHGIMSAVIVKECGTKIEYRKVI